MNTKQRIKNLISNSKNVRSIAALERALGLSNGTINKWDKATPNGSNIQKVANYFNVSTDYLLGNTDDMHAVAHKISPDDVTIRNKIDTSGLNEEELEKLNSYLEFLKSEHARIMNERKK